MGEQAARASAPVHPANDTVARPDLFTAEATLKKEHGKLVVGLAIAGTVITIVINIILLVLADKIGGGIGGAFLILIGIAAAGMFLTSLMPSKAERFNIANEKVIDPMTGAPLRMLWFSRWMIAMIAVWTLVGSSDYFNKPPAQADGSSVTSTPPPDLVSMPDSRGASTPTRAPTFSDSELQYVTAIHSQAEALSASMRRFSGLASRPEVSNDDWRLSMAKELAIWQITYGESQKLRPSAKFSGLQECWVGALGDLNNASNEIASGIDHSDAEEIRVANNAIVRSNGRVQLCVQQMTSLSAGLVIK